MAEKDERTARKPRPGKAAKTEEKREGGARTKPAGKTSTRETGKATREAAPKKKQEAPRAEGEERTGGRGKAAVSEAEAAAEKERVEAREEREVSEEEFHRIMEESLERVTVADVVLTMMNQLASMGYLKMGLPENVNLKYRDLDQALLAIDTLEAMLKGAEGKVPEENLRPFRGVLANLQLNFVQIRRG